MVLKEGDMVGCPVPGDIPHPGPILVLRLRGDVWWARVARGTASAYRTFEAVEVIDFDDHDGKEDAKDMGLVETTYFYEDEYRWVPVAELRPRRGFCPQHILKSLRDGDPKRGSDGETAF